MNDRFDPERVKSFADKSGITLTPWQIQALDVLSKGGVVIRARRCGWSTLQQLVRDSRAEDDPVEDDRP